MDLECDVLLSSTLASLSPDSASASVIASIPPEAATAVRSSDLSRSRSRRNRTTAKYRVGRPREKQVRLPLALPNFHRVTGLGQVRASTRNTVAETPQQNRLPEGTEILAPFAHRRAVWRRRQLAAMAVACCSGGTRLRLLWPPASRSVNITWRHEIGGSAIEASKIAGHSEFGMTGEFTFVALDRQGALTRAIQERLAQAAPQDHGPDTAPRNASVRRRRGGPRGRSRSAVM